MAKLIQIQFKVFILQLVISNYKVLADNPFQDQFFQQTGVPYGFFDRPHEQYEQYDYDNEIVPRRRESLEEAYFKLFLPRPPNSQPTSSEENFEDLADRFKNNLTEVSAVCPRDSCFASYNPSHRMAVSNLASLYKGRSDFGGLMEMSKFLKGRQEVHPQVWYTSMMRAQLMQMPETLSMRRPNPIYLFPTRFFPDTVMKQRNSRKKCAVLDERVGMDNGIENRLWYFREDVLLNAHHWVWHLLYPLNATEVIDRRGEAFYFFHHEMTARYIAERFSNDLDETVPFNFQLNSVVEEGYNPHLTDGVSSTVWATRPPQQSLSAVLNSTTFEQLYNLTLNRDRVVDALFEGMLIRTGNTRFPIHMEDNINELGELSEASTRSANPDFYGTSGYHNQGHLILAALTGDAPRGSLGPMGDETTAMRDIIFYRWHKLVDMLFQTYKELHLPPYGLYEGSHPLIFEGVDVTSIQVLADGAHRYNDLRTFWNTRYMNLQGGLDFNGRNVTTPPNLNVCVKHLDHEEFTHVIKVVNHRKEETPATVRIFLAPRYKPTSKGLYRYTMAEQRSLFFTLDSYTTILMPGNNILKRKSIDSVLTASWPKSVERLRQDIMTGRRELVNCECGFPHHLLLPKGKEEGMIFDIFVMLTDAVEDRKIKPMPRKPSQMRKNNDIPQCIPSHIHCGNPGKNFPDAKPMGYPFDRRPYSVPKGVYYGRDRREKVKFAPVQLLEEYVSYVPNMATSEVLITHENVQMMRQ